MATDPAPEPAFGMVAAVLDTVDVGAHRMTVLDGVHRASGTPRAGDRCRRAY